MSAAGISHVEVTDLEEYARYVPIAEHGGVLITRGGPYRQLEGRDRARNVVVRFPALEAAVACYNCGTYRQALVRAAKSSVRDVVVVEENL